MALHVALHHRTVYRYDRPVTLSPHLVRLRPASHARTAITAYSLTVEPERHFCNWQQDPHGNRLARLVFPKSSDHLIIEVDLVAHLVTVNPFDFFLDDGVERWGFAYTRAQSDNLRLYLRRQAAGPRLRTYLAGLPLREEGTVDRLVAINRAIQQDIAYLVRMEPGVQTCEQTLGLRSGSCRDSAWLLVQVLRHLGLAARFVSGYLIQVVADQKPLDGPEGTTRDFTDLHAWAEVYLPGAGWVGLDPTSGLLCGEGHIPVACTATPADAAPIDGGFTFAKRSPRDKVSCDFQVEMAVTRIDDHPRATKPYREDQWQAIRAIGRRIDDDLIAQDVRLTQGGEPTFVSADDIDGAEWTSAALGPRKRVLADELLRRLHRRFAPGGVLHHGQGKWYPGESLPRWAFTCWWRKDGQPLWHEPALLADERAPRGHTAIEAEAFARALSKRLTVGDQHLIPGYEDLYYYAWRERRLPANVSPEDSRLDDAEERDRLFRIFDRGLGGVTGWTLPLRRWEGAWQTGPWFLRREHLFLLPGDSPMGYRLPLDSLPWVPEDQRLQDAERDPLEQRPALPSRRRLAQAPGQEPRDIAADDGDHMRTALCVEARGGILHIFLPPVSLAEDWCDLIAAIEDTAATTGLAVQLEGYGAPRDPRLRSFAVTPDPGVIEANVHPAETWDELEDITFGLYQDARDTRLRSEKFDLDGRHTGTGGGNHVTFGGPTPADSPFLRRPDLLRSLLGYLHNHPSLTYLFCGAFVGATSQAPRPDEARSDTAYELEQGLRLLDGIGDGPVPPWIADRILRNLLVDVTGNTHRSQVSIDKLFAPETASGRLGLVELRALEMPPDPKMALCQFALLRGLVSSFWRRPYRAPLARWGTGLHDRWMLPWFLREDLDEVIDDLRQSGYAFDRGWFDSQDDFRFPVYGRMDARGVEVELRHALEPWEVLGEEPAGGGTVRYVDSSMERLQVLVRGADPGRWIVACNGIQVPLRRANADTALAGVRYRAWQPPACLHPTVGVHAPLVFDLVDTWSGRSVAGCRYHVAHPGGRSYDRFPVNAFEAEARRMARFEPFGHSPGAIMPRSARPNPEFPMTLDLRRESVLA